MLQVDLALSFYWQMSVWKMMYQHCVVENTNNNVQVSMVDNSQPMVSSYCVLMQFVLFNIL